MSKLNLWRTICLVGIFCALAVIGSPAGNFTTLVSFNGTDGGFPSGTLIQGLNGNFYGTTAEGGADTAACGGTGCGNVFAITSGGKLTTLHTFDVTEGNTPVAGLVLATNGNF